jgi:transcription antitermination factor NusG
MPLLPPEAFVWPDDLLARPTPPVDTAARWWALHTRPRAEKTLARHFLGRELSFFLPLAKKRWRNRGRLFTSTSPLFPGYIFLWGDEEARVAALTTNQVAHCIRVEDQAQLHQDLARVHRLMVSGAPLTPEERIQPGDWVEITSGPLEGLQGKIIRRGKHLRFFVEVHFLQRGASVEIDASMIRPTEPPDDLRNSSAK